MRLVLAPSFFIAEQVINLIFGKEIMCEGMKLSCTCFPLLSSGTVSITFGGKNTKTKNVIKFFLDMS
jgi:hypothetical protein